MTGTAPLALVVGAPGTNRGRDAETALELAGARATHVSITDLMLRPAVMRSAHMLVVAGGFSHADALGAGRLFARSLARLAEDELGSFIARRRPVIGICNGFQALVGAGLLPGALGHNASGHFQCEWVTLQPVQDSVCVWTKNLEPFDCPIAHGEGRYVHPDHEALQRSGQVALRYERDPNGSVASVAGVCDPTGVVLGLMPHPENHSVARQHPLYRRRGPRPLGLQLFERGIAHAREIA
jgi:phosphoribosylformylglycinamidine synthase I